MRKYQTEVLCFDPTLATPPEDRLLDDDFGRNVADIRVESCIVRSPIPHISALCPEAGPLHDPPSLVPHRGPSFIDGAI